MTELERYINANPGAFDSEPVPAGSRDRFMAAVNAERRKLRHRRSILAFTGMAAAAALALVLSFRPDLSKELERHHSRLAEKENEIMVMAEREFPYELESLRNTIRSITTEAIPLEDQLPDELPVKEKSRILNDYYNQKYAALESLMAEYR